MRKTILVFVALLLSLPVIAANDIVRVDTQTPLRAVYFNPDQNTDLIIVGIVILAGEVDSTYPEGLSHYLEHLVFWHADKLGEQTMHARGGNAWVDGIVTTFYNVGEAPELNDMFEFALRTLTPPDSDPLFMQQERDVVAREYDLRVLENPDYRVITAMRKRLYDEHPVSRSVIGTPDSIMSLTVEQAQEYHQRFYQASNAVLFVSGNLRTEQVARLVDETFSSLTATQPHEQSWRQANIQGNLDETQIFPEAQAKSSRLAYASLSALPESDDPLQQAYTVQLTSRLLSSALPGSLAKPLRLDNFIISDYELMITKQLQQQIELVILASPDVGVTLKKVQSSLQEALAQQGLVGIPTDSLERIRKRMVQTAKREGRDPQTRLNRAIRHLSLGLQPNSVEDHIARIEAITKQDVDELLAALGNPQRKVTGLITAGQVK